VKKYALVLVPIMTAVSALQPARAVAANSDIQSLTARAKAGDVSAQSDLGLMYATGKGGPQNDTEAVKWYRLAASQGDVDAQYFLGSMYDEGRGVPQNYVEAAKWYRLAAERGDASAQYSLGALYEVGDGVPQSDIESVKWYRLSAQQGNAYGQKALGDMFADGRGVSRNDVEAAKWYRLAADQGNAKAKSALVTLSTTKSATAVTDKKVKYYAGMTLKESYEHDMTCLALFSPLPNASKMDAELKKAFMKFMIADGRELGKPDDSILSEFEKYALPYITKLQATKNLAGAQYTYCSQSLTIRFALAGKLEERERINRQ